MDIALRGIHVGAGELTLLFTIGTLVVLAWGSSETRALRAKILALLGAVFAFVSWIVSGIYYVVYYGPLVKPTIKAGSWPWAHSIFMEAKEHIFLFLPVLAILLLFLVWKYGDEWQERDVRFSILAVGSIAILIPVIMAAAGFLVSSGYRIGV